MFRHVINSIRKKRIFIGAGLVYGFIGTYSSISEIVLLGRCRRWNGRIKSIRRLQIVLMERLV